MNSARKEKWRTLQFGMEQYIVFCSGYNEGLITVDGQRVGTWKRTLLANDGVVYEALLDVGADHTISLTTNRVKVLRYKVMIALIEHKYEDSL
jgi:hypothetical protein